MHDILKVNTCNFSTENALKYGVTVLCFFVLFFEWWLWTSYFVELKEVLPQKQVTNIERVDLVNVKCFKIDIFD